MNEYWLLDLIEMRKAGPIRWTDEQLDTLKRALNLRGMIIVSDAIGSLQFDKIELKNKLEERS
jgi:hypothetical protein